MTGDPIPAGITAGALLKAHGLAALAAVAPVLLTTAYVSLAAILTRSTVAALVIGLVITTVEQLFRSFAPMLEPYAPAWSARSIRRCPAIMSPMSAAGSPTGEVVEVPFPSGAFSTSSAVSLAIVAAWTLAPRRRSLSGASAGRTSIRPG